MNDSHIHLVNVVGGGDLRSEVDLHELAQSLDEPVVRYDPEHHPSLYIKLEDEGATILLFRTGKYNIAGASSIDDLLTTNNRFLSAIDAIRPENIFQERNFEIRNMVYTYDFKKEFDLSRLTVVLGMENSEYEPEQFPGLQYKPQNSEGLFLIFRTGKVVLTGVASENQADQMFSGLESRLRNLGAI